MKTMYEKKAKAIVIPPQFTPNKVLSSNANNP